jgi:MFS family permease
VLDLTHSAADLGFVLAAGVIPRAAMILFGGVWADRLPRQKVMLASDAARALIQVALAVLVLSHSATIGWFVALSGSYGAVSAFFDPASAGLLPSIVGKDRLQQANALFSLSQNVARVVGPALAALVIAISSVGVTFAVDAATFLISVLTLAGISVPVGSAEKREAESMWKDLAEGWSEMTSRDWIWPMVIGASVFQFAFAGILVLGPIVCERHFGGASGWATVEASAGIGAVLGGLIGLHFEPSRPLFVGCLAISLFAFEPLLFAIHAPLLTIAAAATVGSVGLSFMSTLWFTALQRFVPEQSISRVCAWDWFGSIVAQPLGLVVAGPISVSFGISPTLLVVAGVAGCVGVGLAMMPGIRTFPMSVEPVPGPIGAPA